MVSPRTPNEDNANTEEEALKKSSSRKKSKTSSPNPDPNQSSEGTASSVSDNMDNEPDAEESGASGDLTALFGGADSTGDDNEDEDTGTEETQDETGLDEEPDSEESGVTGDLSAMFGGSVSSEDDDSDDDTGDEETQDEAGLDEEPDAEESGVSGNLTALFGGAASSEDDDSDEDTGTEETQDETGLDEEPDAEESGVTGNLMEIFGGVKDTSPRTSRNRSTISDVEASIKAKEEAAKAKAGAAKRKAEPFLYSLDPEDKYVLDVDPETGEESDVIYSAIRARENISQGGGKKKKKQSDPFALNVRLTKEGDKWKAVKFDYSRMRAGMSGVKAWPTLYPETETWDESLFSTKEEAEEYAREYLSSYEDPISVSERISRRSDILKQPEEQVDKTFGSQRIPIEKTITPAIGTKGERSNWTTKIYRPLDTSGGTVKPGNRWEVVYYDEDNAVQGIHQFFSEEEANRHATRVMTLGTTQTSSPWTFAIKGTKSEAMNPGGKYSIYGKPTFGLSERFEDRPVEKGNEVTNRSANLAQNPVTGQWVVVLNSQAEDGTIVEDDEDGQGVQVVGPQEVQTIRKVYDSEEEAKSDIDEFLKSDPFFGLTDEQIKEKELAEQRRVEEIHREDQQFGKELLAKKEQEFRGQVGEEAYQRIKSGDNRLVDAGSERLAGLTGTERDRVELAESPANVGVRTDRIYYDPDFEQTTTTPKDHPLFLNPDRVTVKRDPETQEVTHYDYPTRIVPYGRNETRGAELYKEGDNWVVVGLDSKGSMLAKLEYETLEEAQGVVDKYLGRDIEAKERAERTESDVVIPPDVTVLERDDETSEPISKRYTTREDAQGLRRGWSANVKRLDGPSFITRGPDFESPSWEVDFYDEHGVAQSSQKFYSEEEADAHARESLTLGDFYFPEIEDAKSYEEDASKYEMPERYLYDDDDEEYVRDEEDNLTHLATVNYPSRKVEKDGVSYERDATVTQRASGRWRVVLRQDGVRLNTYIFDDPDDAHDFAEKYLGLDESVAPETFVPLGPSARFRPAVKTRRREIPASEPDTSEEEKSPIPLMDAFEIEFERIKREEDGEDTSDLPDTGMPDLFSRANEQETRIARANDETQMTQAEIMADAEEESDREAELSSIRAEVEKLQRELKEHQASPIDSFYTKAVKRKIAKNPNYNPTKREVDDAKGRHKERANQIISKIEIQRIFTDGIIQQDPDYYSQAERWNLADKRKTGESARFKPGDSRRFGGVYAGRKYGHLTKASREKEQLLLDSMARSFATNREHRRAREKAEQDRLYFKLKSRTPEETTEMRKKYVEEAQKYGGFRGGLTRVGGTSGQYVRPPITELPPPKKLTDRREQAEEYLRRYYRQPSARPMNPQDPSWFTVHGGEHDWYPEITLSDEQLRTVFSRFDSDIPKRVTLWGDPEFNPDSGIAEVGRKSFYEHETGVSFEKVKYAGLSPFMLEQLVQQMEEQARERFRDKEPYVPKPKVLYTKPYLKYPEGESGVPEVAYREVTEDEARPDRRGKTEPPIDISVGESEWETRKRNREALEGITEELKEHVSKLENEVVDKYERAQKSRSRKKAESLKEEARQIERNPLPDSGVESVYLKHGATPAFIKTMLNLYYDRTGILDDKDLSQTLSGLSVLTDALGEAADQVKSESKRIEDYMNDANIGKDPKSLAEPQRLGLLVTEILRDARLSAYLDEEDRGYITEIQRRLESLLQENDIPDDKRKEWVEKYTKDIEDARASIEFLLDKYDESTGLERQASLERTFSGLDVLHKALTDSVSEIDRQTQHIQDKGTETVRFIDNLKMEDQIRRSVYHVNMNRLDMVRRYVQEMLRKAAVRKDDDPEKEKILKAALNITQDSAAMQKLLDKDDDLFKPGIPDQEYIAQQLKPPRRSLRDLQGIPKKKKTEKEKSATKKKKKKNAEEKQRDKIYDAARGSLLAFLDENEIPSYSDQIKNIIQFSNTGEGIRSLPEDKVVALRDMILGTFGNSSFFELAKEIVSEDSDPSDWVKDRNDFDDVVSVTAGNLNEFISNMDKPNKDVQKLKDLVTFLHYSMGNRLDSKRPPEVSPDHLANLVFDYPYMIFPNPSILAALNESWEPPAGQRVVGDLKRKAYVDNRMEKGIPSLSEFGEAWSNNVESENFSKRVLGEDATEDIVGELESILAPVTDNIDVWGAYLDDPALEIGDWNTAYTHMQTNLNNMVEELEDFGEGLGIERDNELWSILLNSAKELQALIGSTTFSPAELKVITEYPSFHSVDINDDGTITSDVSRALKEGFAALGTIEEEKSTEESEATAEGEFEESVRPKSEMESAYDPLVSPEEESEEELEEKTEDDENLVRELEDRRLESAIGSVESELAAHTEDPKAALAQQDLEAAEIEERQDVEEGFVESPELDATDSEMDPIRREAIEIVDSELKKMKDEIDKSKEVEDKDTAKTTLELDRDRMIDSKVEELTIQRLGDRDSQDSELKKSDSGMSFEEAIEAYREEQTPEETTVDPTSLPEPTDIESREMSSVVPSLSRNVVVPKIVKFQQDEDIKTIDLRSGEIRVVGKSDKNIDGIEYLSTISSQDVPKEEVPGEPFVSSDFSVKLNEEGMPVFEDTRPASNREFSDSENTRDRSFGQRRGTI